MSRRAVGTRPGASLASATGRRIAYPTPERRVSPQEVDLSIPTPMAEGHERAAGDGTGPLLAMLIDRAHPVSGGRLSIRDRRVTIGREGDNDLVIDDPSVSAHHAVLELSEGVWQLRDLGSINGTAIDGSAVGEQEAPVALGSTVRFGSVDLTFSSLDRWSDSSPEDPPNEDVDHPSLPTTSQIADVVASEFELDIPTSRPVTAPLLVGLAITVVAIVGYLLSRGG